MKIITIGAHLDDIELGCGGTIAKAIKYGHIVKMVVLSKSGYTHYSGKYSRPEDIAILEGKKASEVLGVSDFEIYDYPAKDIENSSAVIESLNKIFDDFNPDLILTHWAFDTHKSHANTLLNTLAAGRYFNSIMMYEPFPPAGRSYMTFRPQFYIDITDTISLKLQALREHKTELSKYGDEWVNSIEARARLRGFELISSDYKTEKYAEAFEVVRLNLNILK